MSQPSSSDGVVTSARARPGERSSRPASRSSRPGRRRHTSAATPSQTRSRSTSRGPGRASQSSRSPVISCRRSSPASLPHRLARRSAARSSCRARCARLFTVPSGTPISSATSATGRSSTYISRQTSPVRAALRAERADGVGEFGPGQRGLRRVGRVPPVGRDQGGQQQFGRARGGAATAPPAAGRSPTASRPPSPPAGSRARPARPRGRSPAARPRRRRRAAPTRSRAASHGACRREQLPQRGVVAARHRGDQLIVVHRFSIASRRQPVHASGEIPHPRANHELRRDRVAAGAGHLAGGTAAAAGWRGCARCARCAPCSPRRIACREINLAVTRGWRPDEFWRVGPGKTGGVGQNETRPPPRMR